jgi:hypothetical protein
VEDLELAAGRELWNGEDVVDLLRVPVDGSE